MYDVAMQSLYYNWTRPLTLRLVRRLHRGVRRHQRIPQLAHSLVIIIIIIDIFKVA